MSLTRAGLGQQAQSMGPVSRTSAAEAFLGRLVAVLGGLKPISLSRFQSILCCITAGALG